jgi:Pyruvate/2-oxoacid:ferredoxin oxidoreductase gamma subunit
VLRVDAARMAREFGRVQLENVVLLGFACTLEGFPIQLGEIKERLALHPNERVRAMNLLALDAGSKACMAERC